VAASWDASEASIAAPEMKLGALVAEAGRNGVGARLAAVRTIRTDGAVTPVQFAEARDGAMARGGRAVYAAVGYVTGEAMSAAKAVMLTADQAGAV